MTRLAGGNLGWVPIAFALVLAACSQQPSAGAQPVKKIFALSPQSPMVQLGFLTAQLRDLTIREQVDPHTGKIIRRPNLHGTLRIWNRSTDQSARLIHGEILFLNAAGEVIPVPKNRGRTAFDFTAFNTRLAPGRKTSLAIDVPFPQAGIPSNTLRSARLVLTYLPTPYMRQAASLPLSLKG